jgi:hypothetical protein
LEEGRKAAAINRKTGGRNMLGEKFQATTAKISGTRVLPGELGPKVEVSYQGTGTIYGTETTELGTYTSVMQPSGTLLGEGQGVAMTKDGESVAWRGFGVGRPTGKGLGASYRYALSFQTTSSKLARLNGLFAVGEWEVDENGNAKGSAWEWK